MEGTGVGTAGLTVTARDPEGAEAAQQATVTVLPKGLPDVVVRHAGLRGVEVPSGGHGEPLVFTVENVGRAPVETGRARLFGSHDGILSPSDSVLEERVLASAIAPGGAVTLSYTVASADPNGTRFHAGLCVDSVPEEKATGNNCSPAVQVSVVASSGTDPASLVPAYLTQAVQSPDFAVPLVAGEPALLRVFVDGGPTGAATGAPMPPAQAVFHDGDNEVYVADIPLAPGPIPARAAEGDLRSSANVTIPGNIVRPGLEMVVRVDPDGLLGPTVDVAGRIPALGRVRVDVQSVSELELTLVPLVWSENPDRSVIDVIDAAAADPEGHQLLRGVRDLLPVLGLSVSAHDPVTSSSNKAHELLTEIEMIRVMEGRAGYYMGLMAQFEMYGGVAFRPGRSSVAVPVWGTVAHELGHNMSLGHAPCGDPTQLDPAFPYADGSIGAWGYDFRGGGRLVPPTASDLMSYCFNQRWISDYHFGKALAFRILNDGAAPPFGASVPAKSLLLWGGVGQDGVPFLEPAFVVDAPPALCPRPAPNTASAATPSAVANCSPSASTCPKWPTATAAPASHSRSPCNRAGRAAWPASPCRVPGGSATLDHETPTVPMTILRDPAHRSGAGVPAGPCPARRHLTQADDSRRPLSPNPASNRTVQPQASRLLTAWRR